MNLDLKLYQVKFYSLSDSEGNVFYIGCTIGHVRLRLAAHLAEAKDTWAPNQRKCEKIRSLDYKVTLTILEILPVEARDGYRAQRSCFEKEKQYILEHLKKGCELVNERAKPIQQEEEEYVGMKVTSPSLRVVA